MTVRLALLVLVALVGPAAAETCTGEAADLRAQLDYDADKAGTWRFAWATIFGGASAISLSLALADPVPSLRTGFFVSSAKAGIGAGAKIILPLRVPHPDTCDVAILRRALREAAKHEKTEFFLDHIGGLAVNLGGMVIVGELSGWDKGILSFVTSYPVGLLSIYTMPRGSWQTYRDVTWTVMTAPQRDGWQVAIAGSF